MLDRSNTVSYSDYSLYNSNNNYSFLSLTSGGQSGGSVGQQQKISGSGTTVSGVSAAGNVGAEESTASRIGRVNGELTPDTRTASQGQRLYCMA